MMQRRSSVKEGDKCEKYGVCDRNVAEKDAGIACELCEKWFHAGCVKISDNIYKILGKMMSLYWYCEPCNNGARKLLGNFSKLNERICQLELEQKLRNSTVLN